MFKLEKESINDVSFYGKVSEVVCTICSTIGALHRTVPLNSPCMHYGLDLRNVCRPFWCYVTATWKQG